ncbi:MAG: hypothetical protein ISQ84_03145 [Pelagibacterales bacterium]|nr:hypothetical protein [Pelagibacterales bacterium]
MSDKDNIIQFPTNRIVEPTKVGKLDPKMNKKIKDQQTRQFVETAVDDISMIMLRQLYDLSIKTDKHTFTKDLALVVDMIRGLVYRDFDMTHPAQKLTEKLVNLKINKDGTQSAKIDYSSIIDVPSKTPKPLSSDVKNELKDLNDQAGFFDGDKLDD